MYSFFMLLLLVFASAYILHLVNNSTTKLLCLLLTDCLYMYLGGHMVIGLFYLLPLSATAVLTFNAPIRKQIVSNFFYDFIKKQLPPISETEQIALDAGGCSFEANIFQNNVDYHANYPLTDSVLTEAEQHFVNEKVSELCTMLDEWDINMKEADLPKAAWNFIKSEGFLGLMIPKEYGGHGFSSLAHSMVVNKIAGVSSTAAVTVMVPNSLGPSELLMHYGTDLQKQHYLPRLATGEDIPCFGLTTTEAGSDATSIKDTGVICEREIEGKKVRGILLNFEKRYITLAPIATVIGVAFKLYDPNGLLGQEKNLGITLALIPRDTAGIEIGARHYPMLQSFMNGPIIGKDVFISFDQIIGGQEKIGQGWRMLMECLSIGRGISLPALGNACSKMMYLSTSAYSVIREQFGRSIADFEGVNVLLAKQAGQAYLSEAQRRMNLHAIDQDEKPSLLSAISKLHMTQMGRESVEIAMDVHAGKAIQMGPTNYVAWSYLAIPVAITVEGANILTRNLIVFGQGLMRCHQHIKPLVDLVHQTRAEAIEDKFDQTLFAFINGSISNVAAVICNHLTAGYHWISRFNPDIKKHCRQHYVLTCKLALVSDLCLAILGGKLKIKESVSARLGDALSFLTMHYAAQRYYLSHRNSEEQLYFEWVSEYCFHETEKSLRAVLDNLPNQKIAFLLKCFVFPWGEQFSAPSDKLSNQLGKLAHKDHSFRERIKKQMFLTPTLEALESAFLEKVRLKKSYIKVMQAVKVGQIEDNLSLEMQVSAAYQLKLITESEYRELTALAKEIMAIITVDKFENLRIEAYREQVACQG